MWFFLLMVAALIAAGIVNHHFKVQIHCGADTVVVYCCHLSSNNLKLAEGRWASLEEGRSLRKVAVVMGVPIMKAG